MAVSNLVLAMSLGAWLGGAEAAAAAAVGLVVAGLGTALVMFTWSWGVAEVAFVDWEAELAGDMARMRLAEAEAEEDEAWEAEVEDWQAMVAAEGARRRRLAERVLRGGG